MQYKIMQLEFEGGTIRLVSSNSSDPWFVYNDICAVLPIAESAQQLRRLSESEQKKISIHTHNEQSVPIHIISRLGLFRLIAGNLQPKVQRFKRWVGHIISPISGNFSRTNTQPQIRRYRESGDFSTTKMRSTEGIRMVDMPLSCTTPIGEPMINAHDAASALHLPCYWFTNQKMRDKYQIPHYVLGGVVRYRASELVHWTQVHNTNKKMHIVQLSSTDTI